MTSQYLHMKKGLLIHIKPVTFFMRHSCKTNNEDPFIQCVQTDLSPEQRFGWKVSRLIHYYLCYLKTICEGAPASNGRVEKFLVTNLEMFSTLQLVSAATQSKH